MIFAEPAASPESKHAHYAQICARLGYTLTKRPLLIGIRGLRIRAAAAHPTVNEPVYDDSFVLLWRDETGAYFCIEFPGATHPYQKNTRATVDVNGDGVADVGMIREGLLVFETLDVHSPKVWIKLAHTDPRVPTDRDTNHDGKISETERDASAARVSGPQVDPLLGDYATEVLFHAGFTSGKSSIGCQTAEIEDVRRIAERNRGDFLLVSADRWIEAATTPVDAATRERAEGLVAMSLMNAEPEVLT